jgi:two-component system sensor histidine kinase VicK
MDTIQQLRDEIAQYRTREKEMSLRIEELTDFIENASIPLHWVDGQGMVIWANQAELDALGYTKEEYIGAPISRFHADQETIGDILKRLVSNETLHNYKAKLKCKDGSIKHVLISSNVRRKDGKFMHTRCFTRDITEIVMEQERKAELIHRLEESETQLRMATDIIESSYDAIISKKLDNTITSWNSSAEAMFGYTAEEMINKSTLLLLPEDLSEEEQEIHGRLKRGERLTHFETRRITKDKKVLEVSLTMSPIIDASGKITGISKIIRDITEQKLVEQRKNDFVAMVSHELKTPLTSILSYIQLLLSKVKKAEDSFGIQTLTRTETQAKRMVNMINDFLNVSRLEEAKVHLSKSEFELHDLVQEIIQEIQVTNTNHYIESDSCEAMLYADRDKIGQVFTNLISNAIKYSPTGGTINIRCELVEGRMKASVTDKGIGISRKDQEKLFERFYRVDDERTKNVSGFGIGLYLVSEILRYHETKIEVQSTIGEGSTFFFTLPVL